VGPHGDKTAGYRGDRTPDRADAMAWALSQVFPAIAQEARRVKRDPPKVILAYPNRWNPNGLRSSPQQYNRRGNR
jgi:hypothetical protein